MKGNSWINYDKLKELYVDEKKSTYKISNLYGVTPPSVRYWLNKWNIGLRSKGEAQIGSLNPYWVGGPDNYKKNKNVEYAISYKKIIGCLFCGYKNFAGALEYHHRDPDKKMFFITKRKKRSFYELKKEIDKCDVICSNCHKEVHKRKHPYKGLKSKMFIKNKKLVDKIKMSLGCPCCGYVKYSGALEFHHLDKSLKSFTIGRTLSMEKNTYDIIHEMNKCVILCSNCHKEVDGGFRKIAFNGINFFDFIDNNFEIGLNTIKNWQNLFKS